MRLTGAAVAVLMVALPCAAQLYDARECGSDPVNWVKAQFSGLDPADPDVAARFEHLVDLYWEDSAAHWCSPTGAVGTGWGHDKGLMYFALYDAAMIYQELTRSGVVFSPTQTHKFEDILFDGGMEAANGRYYYFGTCNLYEGRVNIDNSCAEDDESISKLLAVIHNLFPRVTERLGGRAAVMALEKSFLEKAFSTDYANGGGLLLIDGEVVLPNHGGRNDPYAAINLIGLNNARDAYLLAGHPLPDWYANPNAAALFRSLQTTALPDGSAFTDDCVRNDGKVVACNDPRNMNAVPTMLPAGRFVRAVFGESAFTPGLFTFEKCDLAVIAQVDRANQYCAWNPGQVPLQLLAITATATLEIRWLDVDGAGTYDVWGPSGRVAADVRGREFIFANVPCDTPFTYSVYAFGERGRVLGGAWGSTLFECTTRRARRHLGP